MSVKWVKANCPICGKVYEYIEGKPMPKTCSKFDCLQKAYKQGIIK